MTDEDLDNGTFGGSVGLSAACWNRTFATFSAEDILHCRCCVARLKQFRQGRGDDSTTVQCFAGSGWMTPACVLGGLPLMSLLTDSWFMRVFFPDTASLCCNSLFPSPRTYIVVISLPQCEMQSAIIPSAGVMISGHIRSDADVLQRMEAGAAFVTDHQVMDTVETKTLEIQAWTGDYQ